MILNEQITWGEPGSQIYLANFADGISDFELDPGRVAELLPVLRGKSVVSRDYGNGSSELKFTRVVQHGSALAARQFMFAHARDFHRLPDGVSRTLRAIYRTGGDFTFTIPDAIVTAMPGRMKGASSYHTYNIQGGAIS